MKFKDIEYEKPIFPHKEKRVHMVDRAAIITVNDGHHHQEIFLNKNDLHARRGWRERRREKKTDLLHVQYSSLRAIFSKWQKLSFFHYRRIQMNFSWSLCWRQQLHKKIRSISRKDIGFAMLKNTHLFALILSLPRRGVGPGAKLLQ